MPDQLPTLLALALALLLAAAALRALLRLARPRTGLSAVTARGVRWRARPLLNRSERIVFAAAEAAARSADPSWRVFAQVSLGEVIAVDRDGGGGAGPEARRAAFRWVNSKRLDMLVADADGWPLLAVEYQGAGHFQGADWRDRDATKRAALAAAGVPLLEVRAGEERNPRRLEEAILRALGAGLRRAAETAVFRAEAAGGRA